ncbi:Holliday junction resolvase RuvX [Wolbachia endosymbiont of Dirofilaria (Dirofilaria) immitis]|uniref:Holliday junction resolvase RuvX n=1 Tax=Wolbachia endosymbiont of Dirofilaria (Dirofilaria) immitis TaxID=1812115 RepID=UPI00158CCAB8|nr:Holliday junction resolvase RuvX [Wolbachia endosymbiont of Dirofilaria (Dirofilaria) immitis]QKX02091.1 Holliday junction resolvase RuvX [Wolbachia endosymbiont of Dirofilaria (Dirofilaria) immitis]
MLHKNPAEFLKSIPKDKRIMCLDMGKKQIGIAFSDRTQLIATAHSIYNRKNISKDLGYLNRIFKENEAGSVVIGLPLETGKQRSEWYETIIQFANRMIKKYKINVYLQDESLSTFIATHILKTAGVSIIKSKKIDDKISACIILQRTLDKINVIK